MQLNLKRLAAITALLVLGVSLMNCSTTPKANPNDSNSQTPTPSQPSPTTPPNVNNTPPTPVQRVFAMPAKTIKGNGYTVEMGRTWAYMASLTSGQENVHAVDQYPGIRTTFNGSRVMVSVFVNRLASTPENYVADFIKSQSDFRVLETIKDGDGYLLIMNRKADRNSLRYVRILYHSALRQALAYNLTFRVIGDEQSYRTSTQTDAVAKEILSFFALV